MKRILFMGMALAALSGAARATDMAEKTARVASMAGVCGMQENVNINVNFNLRVESPKAAKEKFDQKIQEIDAFGKKSGVKKWQLQSMNYSVSSAGGYGDDQGYQLSGSASYQTDNADQAFALMEQLSKQKMYVNVGVNKYRNGACQEN